MSVEISLVELAIGALANRIHGVELLNILLEIVKCRQQKMVYPSR